MCLGPEDNISTQLMRKNDMDVIVGIIALVIAAGCVIAISFASRRESNVEKNS
jgi:hypothetical protein